MVVVVDVGRVMPPAEVEAERALGVPVDRRSKPVDVVCQVCFCVTHVTLLIAHFEAMHPQELAELIESTHGPGVIEEVPVAAPVETSGEGMVPW